MFSHQGAFDLSAAQDVIASQCSSNILALANNSTLPVGAITGSQDVVLINSANGPGNQQTRSALLMLQDLIAQLGFQPPSGYQWLLTIVHQGTGTLTLQAGAGVTLGTGTNSVATVTNRTYVCTLVNSSLVNPIINIQTTGSGAA